MPAFAPLDPSIPHTLAPSSPLPSTFTAQTHTLAARLSRTDAPRRKSGVVHHAPQGLGLPELICTGVEGDWEGRRPAWVDAERGEEVEEAEKLEEKEAWRELGVEGIPRDMDEWEDWERVKRGWREERQKERVRAQQAEEAAIITKKLEALVDRSTTDKRRQESTASASTASTSRPSQPTLLTSHFSSSKATVSSFASGKKPPPATSAADSSKKKRPPSSPPVPPPHRHTRRSPSPHEHEAPAPTGKSGDSGKSGKESFPSLSSINSAGRVAEVEAGPSRSSDEQRPRGAGGWREASGEDEEILFEGGYTQMVLPDPTPSARPTISTSAAVPARPSAHSALSPHPPPLNPPWSSPGLHGDPDDSHGKSSTPVPLARPQPLPRIQTSTSSRSSRSPSPPQQAITDHPPRPAPPSRALTNFSTTTTSSITNTNTNGPLRPTVARLSELARTGSALSVRSNGSEAGEGMREIERFLEEEARE